MKKLHAALVLVAALALVVQAAADAAPPLVKNVVASSPVNGGGYPVPAGASLPTPGTCGPISLNANHSESWLAVKPGSETLVGSSKFFVDRYSTYYDFYLGAYSMPNGSPAGNVQMPGFDCVSNGGTQAMPPDWTNNTDPNNDWDTQGRVYELNLPFNAYWSGGLHPNGAIALTYSDDNGKTWSQGNGGQYLDQLSNSLSTTWGHVEDKQWIAVNHYAASRYADHVYAMWTDFNGAGGNGKIMVAVSRDRGQSFSKPTQVSTPSAATPANTYVYPSVGPDGTVYVAFVSGYDTTNKNRVGHVYVARSVDDGKTWGPFTLAATPIENPAGTFPNTNFRDGIIENFTSSQTYPGHVYLTYENYDPSAGTMDVYFTQSTDGGNTWAQPALVNDDAGTAATDQFQPSVAAGPGNAVAVAFYDRHAACPAGDPSISTPGATNTCIAVTLQAYSDSGTAAGAVRVGANVNLSQYAWDPEQPLQTLGGLPQYPCAGHATPCPAGRGFIGDYFGLAISGKNIYALSASTHYPAAGVRADDGGPIYYQQQVLATVSRSALGL
ncbi:MAG: hypothetical protein QOD52_148 [Gaiellaceae bacterium]|nr:hypothetical protein [Gaiellaceae bacterium]